MAKRWRDLSSRTRKSYLKKGISGRRYAAWQRTSAKTRRKLAAKGISRQDYLKAPSTRELKNKVSRKAAVENMMLRLPDASFSTVSRNVFYMTPKELYQASTWGYDKLADRASRKPDRVDDDDTPLNPFWYH
jgi:hypothetical protein